MRYAVPLILFLALVIASVVSNPVRAADYDEAVLASPRRAMIEAQNLANQGDTMAASALFDAASLRHPRDTALLTAHGNLLFDLERYGEAEIIYKRALAIGDVAEARNGVEEIGKKLDAFATNINFAVIAMQKNTDAGNFDTTIAIADRAIARFPDRAILFNSKGEAQYRKHDLEAAEVSFRRSLQIDPFNAEARKYIEDIRTTSQAQTSQALAEWISIAKDKVGDFIVTFLALFTAFVVNSLIAPITLRIKLNNARKMFERGEYDEFTDLIEGLLDEENFTHLRINFRFMLQQKSYEEARQILNKYVNTLERLPTLLRVLEREHEKLLEAG